MNNDLNDAYGNRAIWKIALPMIMSTVSVPLLGLVDTAVLGHLQSPVYLAAVAVGATIFSMLFMTLNFLRMGTTGVAAQAFGAGDAAPILSSLVQPLAIAAALAILLLLLQGPALNIALVLLEPDTTVAPLVERYFSIRIWSAPAMLVNLVLVGWLLGMQNARATLAVFLIVNVSNMLLDVLFVWVLDMNVSGVAMATVMAEYLGTVLALLLVRRELRRHGAVWDPATLTETHRYLRLLRINGSLLLRSLALMFVFAFITARGARLGVDVLAINAVLLNFLYFFSYATDGLANAAEALSGKAVGSNNPAGLALTVRNTLRWTAGFALAVALVYGVAGPAIIDLLTGIEPIRAGARLYLPWLIALPLVAAWCFLYDGIYIGMTRTREMMIIMVCALLLVFLPVWLVLQSVGNHALWAALVSFMAARSLGMHLWYQRMQSTGVLLPSHRPAPYTD